MALGSPVMVRVPLEDRDKYIGRDVFAYEFERDTDALYAVEAALLCDLRFM